MNKTDKNLQTQRTVQWLPEEKGEKDEVDKGKGGKYVVMEGNLTGW